MVIAFSHFLKACIALVLFVKCAAQSWSGAQAVRASDEVQLSNVYQPIGLSVTTSTTPYSDQKVFIMVTANFRSTSSTGKLRLTIFRNNEMLYPGIFAVDATAAGEHYPATFTFIDQPGTFNGNTYTVMALGEGILSYGSTLRSMFWHRLVNNYPIARAYTGGMLWIGDHTTPTSLAITSYTGGATSGGHLIGATSVYTALESDVTKHGYFSLNRDGEDPNTASYYNDPADGTDLSGGTGLMFPSAPLAEKQRTTSILYFDAPAEPVSSYMYTARLANVGDPMYTIGSNEGAGRYLNAISMPPGMGYATTSTTGTLTNYNYWMAIGIFVTVPGVKQASKVLVTVNTFVRTSIGAERLVGRFTLNRNGVNVMGQYDQLGIQTVAFENAAAGRQYREVTFFYVDELTPSTASVSYTLMFKLDYGSFVGEPETDYVEVGQDGVKTQIAAIVVEGAEQQINPTLAPTFAATSISPNLASFMTSPTYMTSPGFAFAARNPTTGTAWTWGQLSATSSTLNVATTMASGTSALVGNRAAYAFLKSDGSLGAFGVGALIDRHTAYAAASSANLVGSLVSNDAAFAGIQSGTGRVIAFGSYYNGGDVSTNARCNGYATQLSSGVVSIVASSAAFAAVKSDGSVYAWGNKFAGGGVSTETRPDLVGVTKVFATASAFAALLATGAVKTWGDAFGGGDSSAVASALSTGVMHIIASQSVFVAYKVDTSIVVWGNALYGGSVSSSVVPALTSGVKFVSFTGTALAALKMDGTVKTWGHASYGGDSSAVSGALTNIAKLYSSKFAFAALTAAGGVVAWGDEENGGLIPSNLASVLSSGVTAIFSTHRAFAALKGATGQLVLWGNPFHGGSASAVGELLNSGVRTVCANDAAFTAILQDGRAVAWGHPSSIPTPGLLQNSPAFTSVDTCATGAVRAGI